MRALLRDHDDNTLMAISVTESAFDPEVQKVYLYAGDSCYTVHEVTPMIADYLIRELFELGRADFTQFGSEVEK